MVLLQPVFRPTSWDYGYSCRPGVHFMIALVFSVLSTFVSYLIITVRAAAQVFAVLKAPSREGKWALKCGLSSTWQVVCHPFIIVLPKGHLLKFETRCLVVWSWPWLKWSNWYSADCIWPIDVLWGFGWCVCFNVKIQMSLKRWDIWPHLSLSSLNLRICRC